MRILLRFYSFLFAFAAALLLVALGAVAIASGHPLRLGSLPWSGRQLNFGLLGAGFAGLLAAWLAARGRARALLFLWCLAVFGLLIWGFFLTPYVFTPVFPFRTAAWLALAAFVAMIGACPASKTR